MLGAQERSRLMAEEARLRSARKGFVGGVWFDLTHDDIDPAVWSCPPILALDHRGDVGLIIASPPRASLLDEGPDDAAPARPAQRKSNSEAARTLHPGDAVSVREVVTRATGTELDPPPDRSVKDASLTVRRVTGLEEELPPLTFHANGSTQARFDDAGALDVLADRLSAVLEVGDLAEVGPDVTGAAGSAVDDYRALAGLTLALRKELGWTPEAERRGLLDADAGRSLALTRMINLAARFGYLAAKAEGDRFVDPLATRGRAATEGGAKGGTVSGQRRQERAERWKAHVRELLPRLINEGWKTQEAIAIEMPYAWQLKDVPCPGLRTLTTYLSELGVRSPSA